MTGREIHWNAAGREFEIRIEESGNVGIIHSGDEAVNFVVHDRDSSGGWIELNDRRHRFYLYRNRDEVVVWLDGHTYRLNRVQKGRLPDQTSTAASGEIRALMPGKILRVDVAVGESVSEKQPVAIMESMKMETTLTAPRAGSVSAVKCQVGQIVEMGELLVIIE